MNKIIAGVLLVAALLFGFYLYHKYRVAPQIKFADLELTDLSGKPVKLDDYKGKKLFVNFFATWCGPCVGEMNGLDNAAEILASNDFVFISVSDEPVERLSAFSNRINAQHILILHTAKKLHDLKVFTVPTNYVVNNNGKVVFEKTGVENWTDPKVLEQLRRLAN